MMTGLHASFANPFVEGGSGMWVVLVYLVAAMAIAWGLAIGQIAAAVLWARRIRAVADLAKDHNPQAILYRAEKGSLKGLFADTLAAAARGSIEQRPAPEVVAEATGTVAARLPVTSPWKACFIAVVAGLSVAGPIALGLLLRSLGYMRTFEALSMAQPDQKCALLQVGLAQAEHPYTFAVIAAVLLAVPALVSVLVELVVLAPRKRRDDVLRVVEILLALPTRPRTSPVPGIVALVFIALVVALSSAVLAGPPVRRLFAPLLYTPCLPEIDDAAVSVPPYSGEASKVGAGTALVVSSSSIGFGYEEVLGLADGKIRASDAPDGVFVTRLNDHLAKIRSEYTETCRLDPSSPSCGATLFVAIDGDVPVATAAAVLATSWMAWSGGVFAVVRTGEDRRPDLDTMIDESVTWRGMRCVKQCRYGLVPVKEVVAKPQAGARGFLDPSASGTFGEYVAGLGGAGIVVALPSH